MMRDYLAVPGTTVDLERGFSIAGDMVTKKRGSLSPETIRATQQLKDWDKSGLFDIVKYWAHVSVRK